MQRNVCTRRRGKEMDKKRTEVMKCHKYADACGHVELEVHQLWLF